MRDPARYMSPEPRVLKKPVQNVERWELYENPIGVKRLTGILMEEHHTNPRLLKGMRCYTSRVVRIDLMGAIVETENTIYKCHGASEPRR
jgi:hypothetical protein